MVNLLRNKRVLFVQCRRLFWVIEKSVIMSSRLGEIDGY